MAKNGTIHVLLVRTGDTEWDEAGRIQGETDLPLSPGGRDRLGREVAALVRSSSGSAWSELDAILHAPDDASRETAATLASATGAKTKSVDGLRAMSMGLWEGQRPAELLERQPKVYQQWLDDPTVVTPPDGEGLLEAQERLLEAIRRATARRQSVAVVLRPPAFGILRLWLQGRAPGDLWNALAHAPQAESFVIERSRFRAAPARLRAGA